MALDLRACVNRFANEVATTLEACIRLWYHDVGCERNPRYIRYETYA